MGIRALAWLGVLLAAACLAPGDRETPPLPTRPNIVLMMVEDLSPRIGAFGDPVARTPNLDRLAREGARYTSVFATSGVCAPSRAAVITGMHQGAIGAQHMRTSDHVWTDGSGRRGYEAVPPPHVKAFPEYLRAAGYYAVNNAKTDYQFGQPFTVWDESGAQADWRNRAEGQPFFAMYSQTATHESSLFQPDSLRAAFPALVASLETLARRRDSLAVRTRPEDVTVPPYYPDTPVVRADIARHYDNIQLMDAWVGERMAELEREGVLDNTIVIWTTDHGDGLPRAKRSLYDSGLKAPMIVRFPDRRGAGGTDDRLISFVDLAPTLLAMAGVRAPDHMQGRDMFDDGGPPQAAVFAARDRLDEWPDLSRAVRTKQFKYIRNERVDQPFYLPLAFRENLPMMADTRRLFGEGGLTRLQASYLETPRPAEELYDVIADPDEIRNLADDREHANVLADLSRKLDDWRAGTGDPRSTPEETMVMSAWGHTTRPTTSMPLISFRAHEDAGVRVTITSQTIGASIGYRIGGEEGWRLYSQPFDMDEGERIEAKAIRYGFGESGISAATAGR